MRNEFTAIIEHEDGWYIGYCPEIPGANGQGRTIEECRTTLAGAISLILEDRREEGQRGVPADGIGDVVIVEIPDKHRNGVQSLEPEEHDSLIGELLASNPKFQELVRRSKQSRRKPFAAGE
jgi:predicted RNase H-like HicB family nuclease